MILLIHNKKKNFKLNFKIFYRNRYFPKKIMRKKKEILFDTEKYQTQLKKCKFYDSILILDIVFGNIKYLDYECFNSPEFSNILIS